MSCLKNFPFVLFFRLRLSKALKVNHFVSIPYLRVVCAFYVIAVVQHRINALCLVLASTLDSTLKFYLSIEKIPCMLADSMCSACCFHQFLVAIEACLWFSLLFLRTLTACKLCLIALVRFPKAFIKFTPRYFKKSTFNAMYISRAYVSLDYYFL